MTECQQKPASRPWLESLSTGELIKLADTYGIDIPYGLERVFVIEEILESANAQEQEIKEDIAVNPSYSETVLLPKQYNISFIEVIIRDPLWAFVFWEIKKHDRDIHENAEDFDGYCLCVIPLNNENTEQEKKEKSFTVSIDTQDCARYLGFDIPFDCDTANGETPVNSGRYVIKLLAIHGDSEVQIASSLPFDLPKLYDNELIAEMSRNPLARLSGVQDIVITKKTDRQSRNKRQ